MCKFSGHSSFFTSGSGTWASGSSFTTKVQSRVSLGPSVIEFFSVGSLMRLLPPSSCFCVRMNDLKVELLSTFLAGANSATITPLRLWQISAGDPPFSYISASSASPAALNSVINAAVKNTFRSTPFFSISFKIGLTTFVNLVFLASMMFANAHPRLSPFSVV